MEERIAAPVRLRDYVSKGTDRDLNDLVQRARSALEVMSSEFLAQADADLATLESDPSPGSSDGPREPDLQEIFRISHDLRGLAGSFGLPILTKVGASLCEFLSNLKSTNTLQRQVIDLHIAAMVQIVTQHVSGEGLPADGKLVDRELVDGLIAARQRALATGPPSAQE